MTPEDFDALFDSFHATVARLETLPAYAVADYEGDRLAAFRDGRPMPLRTIVTDPWLARIAATTMAGKAWSRVRVVDEPLTVYERFELAVFGESQAVGERIRIVRRNEITAVGPDFWLFDADTASLRAVLMRYDDAGHWLGADAVDDPAVIAECRARLAEAEARSVELNEFMAAVAGA